MAFRERANSPPSITYEEETDGILVQNKEQDRGLPPNGREGQSYAAFQASHPQLGFNRPNVTGEQYNAWKYRHNHVEPSREGNPDRHLMSKLGQSLEQSYNSSPFSPSGPKGEFCGSNESQGYFIKKKVPESIPESELQAPVYNTGNKDPSYNYEEYNRVHNLSLQRSPYMNSRFYPPNFGMGNPEMIYPQSNVPPGMYNQPYFRENVSSDKVFPNFKPHYQPETADFGRSYQNDCCRDYPSPNNTPRSSHHGGHPGGRPRRNCDLVEYDGNDSGQCRCKTSLDTKEKGKQTKQDKIKNKQVTDLYRIVWLQNQQLAQLQNQVKKLIEINIRADKSTDQENTPNKKMAKGTKEKRTFNLSVIEENQNLTEKVSVGIMTSFIENGSIKKKGKNKNLKHCPAMGPHRGRSSESDSSSSESSAEEETIPMRKSRKAIRSNNGEESFVLNGLEIPTVAENQPTPPSSFHIDMQDYGSSTSDSPEEDSNSSESASDDEANQTPVGWTFYDTVVGKVNNMLNKSDERDEDTEDEVKNRTVEQLRRLGVSFVESESPLKRVTFDEAACLPQPQKTLQAESDTSFRINALAMKYLKQHFPNDDVDQTGQKGGMSPRNNSNLSYATMRYLERYQLVPKTPAKEIPTNDVKMEKTKRRKDKKKEEKKPTKMKISPRQRGARSKDQSNGKILDITAIKQQPKLLHKK